MKLKRWQRIIIVSMILVLVIPAVAQPRADFDGSRKPPIGMLEELQLTEDQELQMKDLRFKHEKTMIGLRANLDQEKLKLKELKLADEPNRKRIHSQIEKVGEAKTDIAKSRVDNRLEIRKMLTDDQRKIFRKGINEKRTRRGVVGHQNRRLNRSHRFNR